MSLEEVHSLSSSHICLMLIGNKLDLQQHRQVSIDDLRDFSESRQLQFLEVSSKTSENVDTAFIQLCQAIIFQRGKKKFKLNSNPTFN